jgi:hypothetical protein
MESIIGQIKSILHQGDVVQLNVKNLYDAFAKDGECKLTHCEVLKDNQYYDIATEHNKFAYGNDEHCTIEQVMDDGSVLFCTNMTENKSDRFALSPDEVAIAYFGRNSEVTRCSRCGSVCIPEVYTTGYGLYKDGKKYCFKCCGIIDGEKLDQLTPGETLQFYLTKKPGERCKVTNWPGTFEVTCDYDIEGRHNLAGSRTDIGFTYHGRKFFGTQYGRNSEIVYVKVRKNQKFDFNVVLSGTSDGEEDGKTIPVRALNADDAVDEARDIWEPDTLETARVYLGDTDGEPVLTVEF